MFLILFLKIGIWSQQNFDFRLQNLSLNQPEWRLSRPIKVNGQRSKWNRWVLRRRVTQSSTSATWLRMRIRQRSSLTGTTPMQRMKTVHHGSRGPTCRHTCALPRASRRSPSGFGMTHLLMDLMLGALVMLVPLMKAPLQCLNLHPLLQQEMLLWYRRAAKGRPPCPTCSRRPQRDLHRAPASESLSFLFMDQGSVWAGTIAIHCHSLLPEEYFMWHLHTFYHYYTITILISITIKPLLNHLNWAGIIWIKALAAPGGSEQNSNGASGPGAQPQGVSGQVLEVMCPAWVVSILKRIVWWNGED